MVDKRPTRERILDTALELFNEHRFAKVTTAQIAKSCGIAEGNLWYHFNDREALLEGLLERFSRSVVERLQIVPRGDDILESYVSFYLMMAEEFDAYRFFYRDQLDYENLIGKLSDRLPMLYQNTADQFRLYLSAMREQGYIDLSDERLASIITISLMIFRYSSEFSRERNLEFRPEEHMIHYAFRLHMTLYEDVLSDDAKRFMMNAFQLSAFSEYLL